MIDIFKMFKNNMKFTRAAWWITSKNNKWINSKTLCILLCYQYCWPLLCCNCWRSLILWNSTAWSCLKLLQRTACSSSMRIMFQNHHNMTINPFHATCLFRYPLKTSENRRFSDVFRGYRMRPVAWNGSKMMINSLYFLLIKNLKKTLRSLFVDGVQLLKATEPLWGDSIYIFVNQYLYFCPDFLVM